jgi:membrane protein implicated in regulation of membrane protease activity
MEWWIWVLIGLGLLVLEVATPGGFVALFFGVSAILVGGIAALGMKEPLWVQLILFSMFSVGALALLRKPLQARLNVGPRRPVDNLEGEAGVALEDLAAGGLGSVELRGSTWKARNAAEAVIAKGQRCRVERREGLMLFVRPE